MNVKMLNLYWISSKIDGIENPSLKIDGYGRTYQIYASYAPACNSRRIALVLAVAETICQRTQCMVHTYLSSLPFFYNVFCIIVKSGSEI